MNNGSHFWLSVTCRSTVGQQVTDTLPTISNENRVGQLLDKCQSTVGQQLANSIFWELFFTFTPFCFIFAFFVFFARLKTCQWHKCLWFNSPNCLSFLVCQYPPITSLKYHTKWSEWWVSESFTNRREKSYCENKYSTFCGIFPSFFFTHQDTFDPKGYQMHFRLHNTYLSKHSVIQSYDNYCWGTQ